MWLVIMDASLSEIVWLLCYNILFDFLIKVVELPSKVLIIEVIFSSYLACSVDVEDDEESDSFLNCGTLQ